MNFKEKLKAASREPLVHFLIAGLVVFLISSLRGPEIDPNSRKIVLNETQIEQLVSEWQKTWQREPTPTEVDAIIREFIKDEIYFREAIRLGLDKDDLVVRRRLRSKMEYLSNSAAESQIPSEKELQDWLDKNPLKYAIGANYSFEQIYFNADNEIEKRKRTNTILSSLKNGTDWQSLSDDISLPAQMENEDIENIGKVFGEEFANNLGPLPVKAWSEPIASGFGFHIVRILQKTEGRKPKLAEVRAEVERDWRAKTALLREQKSYQSLLDGYKIEIDRPK